VRGCRRGLKRGEGNYLFSSFCIDPSPQGVRGRSGFPFNRPSPPKVGRKEENSPPPYPTHVCGKGGGEKKKAKFYYTPHLLRVFVTVLPSSGHLN